MNESAIKQRPAARIVKTIVLAVSLAICLVSITRVANEAKPIFYPHGFAPTDSDWNDGEASYQFGCNGNIYHENWRLSPIMMPSASPGNPAVIELSSKKNLENDASLFISFDKTTTQPLQLTVSANGVPQARIVHEPGNGPERSFFTRVVVRKEPNARNLHLQIRNEGGSWFGGALLVPDYRMTRFLSIALFPSFILGLISVVSLFSGKPRIMLPLVAVFGYLFYYCLNYPAKLIPCGTCFADSKELVDAIRFNDWSYDMQKHVLFLPVMRVSSAFFSLFSAKPLKILAMSFSFISAMNLVLAAACIRFTGMKGWSKSLLCAVYGTSFSIATYSSIFETYILSALLVNANILAGLYLRKNPTRYRACMAAILCGLLPLATWQLLAFVPFFLTWHSGMIRKGSYARSVRIPMTRHWGIALLSFWICYTTVWGLYSGPFLEAGRPQDTAEVLSETHTTYASLENINWKSLFHVLEDTFVSSIVNTKNVFPGVNDNGDISAIPGVVRFAVGIAAFLVIGTAVAYRLKTSRSFLTNVAFMAGFGAYIGFHLYFNPAEMLLYTPPVILLWLLPVATAASRDNRNHMLDYSLAMLLLSGTALACIGRLAEFKTVPGEAIDAETPEYRILEWSTL